MFQTLLKLGDKDPSEGKSSGLAFEEMPKLWKIHFKKRQLHLLW